MPTTVHVYPLGDLVEHDRDTDDCVCGPEFRDIGDGDWMVVHHALDGREHSEPDHDRASCPLCSDDGS